MTNSIGDELANQSQDMGGNNFICISCKNSTGGYGCSKGVFVAFVGANMSQCIYYEKGVSCPHCGRNV